MLQQSERIPQQVGGDERSKTGGRHESATTCLTGWQSALLWPVLALISLGCKALGEFNALGMKEDAAFNKSDAAPWPRFSRRSGFGGNGILRSQASRKGMQMCSRMAQHQPLWQADQLNAIGRAFGRSGMVEYSSKPDWSRFVNGYW